MDSAIESYLRDLERRLRGRMSAAQISQAVDECRSHLVLAAEDLGSEHEAVARFGSARRLAVGLKDVGDPEPPRTSWYPVVVAGAASIWAAGCLVWADRTYSMPLLKWGLALFAAAFIISSFRSRRSLPIPIASVCFAAGASMHLAFSLTWLDLRPFGSVGFVPVWHVKEARAEMSAARKKLESEIDRLKGRRQAFLAGGEERDTLLENGGWLYPSSQAPGTVIYGRTPDLAVARKQWTTYGRSILSGLGYEVRRIDVSLSALEQAQAQRSSLGLARFEPQVVGITAGWSLSLIVLNGLLVGLGRYARKKRGPRSLPA